MATCSTSSSVQDGGGGAGGGATAQKKKWDILETGDPSASAVCAEALDLLWTHGYPQTPKDYPRLTHGFHYYPAGLQAMSAAKLLEVLPGDSLLDPFMGGGCTLVEGLRTGREVYGADISPLAVLVSTYHCWLATPEQLEQLQRAVEAVADALPPEEVYGAQAADWRHPAWVALSEALFRAARGVPDAATRGALCFCLSATLHRAAAKAGRGRGGRRKARGTTEPVVPVALFTATAHNYVRRVQELVGAVGEGTSAPQLIRCDARSLQLPRKVSAVLTSPPYPAVYNYLSTARSVRARSPPDLQEIASGFDFDLTVVPKDYSSEGVREVWPSEWREGEIGAKRQMRKDPLNFRATWQSDTERWLLTCKRSLLPGGRAAIVIGDGDARFVDCLQSIREGAEQVGLAFVGAATILSAAELPSKQRPEHAILLENAEA